MFLALRLGLVQMAVGINKIENVTKACQMIKEAALKGAKLVALPVNKHLLPKFKNTSKIV